MAPSSSTQFIEAALSCTSPFALSYTDSNQKWLIRKHLLSLLQDFPTFIPSTDSFVHDDGATVNLLNASGFLHISNSAPPIPLTIWLHENYPKMAPIVFIRPDPINPIHQDHPFVDPSSGTTMSPYIKTWLHPGCTLSDLVQNLVKLFSLDHPFFYYSPLISSLSTTHPSIFSKREAVDRLAGTLHYDLAALEAETNAEIEKLSSMQVEIVKRVDIATSIIIGLEHEKMNLKRRVLEVEGEVDVLTNWLKVYDPKSVVAMAGNGLIEDVFEGVGDEAKLVLELLSADMAMEDLIYALDKAVEEGVVNFELYIRQVRILAREQFYYRAKMVKLKGSNVLH